MKIQPIQTANQHASPTETFDFLQQPTSRSTLVSLSVKPLKNALHSTLNFCTTLLYYVSLLWIVDAILYRNHETYCRAKLAGLCTTFVKAKECSKEETILSYIISVKNGPHETRFSVDPKREKECFPIFENWLNTLSKRERCTLSSFSLTIYAVPIDGRWTSLTKDKRNLAIVELSTLSKNRDFFATLRSGDFDFLASHKPTEKSQCAMRGEEHVETYNLRELMEPKASV